MKTLNLYAVVAKSDDGEDFEVIMVFDDKENANDYKEQIKEENGDEGWIYSVEDTKGIIFSAMEVK